MWSCDTESAQFISHKHVCVKLIMPILLCCCVVSWLTHATTNFLVIFEETSACWALKMLWFARNYQHRFIWIGLPFAISTFWKVDSLATLQIREEHAKEFNVTKFICVGQRNVLWISIRVLKMIIIEGNLTNSGCCIGYNSTLRSDGFCGSLLFTSGNWMGVLSQDCMNIRNI